VPGAYPVPTPPYAEDTGLPWDVSVVDAVATIAAARARHGDTFVVESGREHYLFTFSHIGVESFYALTEDTASKAVADYLMLRRKLPNDIFLGRKTLPNTLFRRDDVALYLANLGRALEQTTTELGAGGRVDVFDLTRRLGHRMGLASWAGPGSSDGEAFERLVHALDALDGSEAFVHPDRMAAVAATDKRAERAALDEVADIIAAAVRRFDAGDAGDQALFGRIVDGWSTEPRSARLRGIALDIALIHIASMSNLAAALGWALVDLLEHPAQLARVRSGDTDFAQRCALESTRLAQRSIMTRTVLSTVHFDTGDVAYEVPPGWTIATLLAPAQHVGGAGPERVGSRSKDPPPSDRAGRSALAHAGDRLRARPTLLPGPAVFVGRDDCRYHASAPRVPDDAALDFASCAGAGPNRWRSTGSGSVLGRLCPRLAAISRYFAARWTARSSSAGCHAAPMGRRRPSGSGEATPPAGGSAAPDTGSG
jgi:cytochrome P450